MRGVVLRISVRRGEKIGQELSVERVLGCGMPVRAD